MSGWLRFGSWLRALLTLLVPTRFGLAAAAFIAAPALIASWVIGSCIGRCEATWPW